MTEKNINSFKSSSSNSDSFTLPDFLTQKQQEEINEILDKVNSYSTLTDYNEYLVDEFDLIFADNSFNNQEKDYLLTFIILYSATLEFLEDNPNLFPSSNNSISNSVNNDKIDNIKSWPKWLSWKCLAGAAGMTVAGAAGGCYGGGQLGGLIGSVAGPAGTLSGAITGCGIGAAIGGISGALIGAATFC